MATDIQWYTTKPISRWKPDSGRDTPLRWRKPRHVEVMSDLFHEDVPDAFIVQVFQTMLGAWGRDGQLLPLERRHGHTFQMLTKRPERMRDFMRTHYPEGFSYGNVSLGVSVEDQRSADERIPLLLQTPAAVRFISAEPLLGAVDLRPFLPCRSCFTGLTLNGTRAQLPASHESLRCAECGGRRGWRERLSWVIVGGESGGGARPCDLAWLRGIVAQCRAAGTSVFCKQLGTRNVCPHDRKGGHVDCFPEDLKVREWPDANA